MHQRVSSECEPVGCVHRSTRRQGLCRIRQRPPAGKVRVREAQYSYVQVLLWREAEWRKFTSECSAEDLERYARVCERGSRLVDQRQLDRALEGGHAGAQSAERVAGRQRQQHAKGDAPLPWIRTPGFQRIGYWLVERQQLFPLRNDRGDAPEALRSAKEFVRGVAFVRVAVRFGNNVLAARGDEGFKAVAPRVLEGGFDVDRGRRRS